MKMLKSKNPLLYWPNIVDYIRAILLLGFVSFALSHTALATTFYIIAALLDAVDGVLARKLKQISALGTALDFAIDRLCGTALLFAISQLYPAYWLACCFILLLDLGSHYLHLYTANFCGADHHKKIDRNSHRWLQQYYHHRPTLFFLCFCYEGWLLFALNAGQLANSTLIIASLLLFPGFFAKCLIHVLQIQTACKRLLKADTQRSN
jgi:CDP-diacylglycerol--inositol 3-phosphatidyltransferase